MVDGHLPCTCPRNTSGVPPESTTECLVVEEKCGCFPGQDVFTVLGTPDKVIRQLVGDVFGVLCLHTRQYIRCSSFTEEPHWAALPHLKDGGCGGPSLKEKVDTPNL